MHACNLLCVQSHAVQVMANRPLQRSGDTTPCRMTGVTLQSRPPYGDIGPHVLRNPVLISVTLQGLLEIKDTHRP